MVTIKGAIKNQRGETVVVFTMKVIVQRPASRVISSSERKVGFAVDAPIALSEGSGRLLPSGLPRMAIFVIINLCEK